MALIDDAAMAQLWREAENTFIPTTTTISVAPASWTANGNFYEYSLNNTYPATSYYLEVDLNWDTATTAQADDWTKCQVVGSASTNKLVARGAQPTETFPLFVKIQKKKYIA